MLSIVSVTVIQNEIMLLVVYTEFYNDSYCIYVECDSAKCCYAECPEAIFLVMCDPSMNEL